MPHRLESSDDVAAHETRLEFLMKEADAIIAAQAAGTLTPEQRRRLPHLVASLRQKFEVQMNENDRIVHLDLEDDSYDNSTIDHHLRHQISALRTMDHNMNSSWLLRIPRKVSGWFEDVGKWFRVTKRDVLDGGKQVLKVGGVVGGAAGGAYLGTMLGGPLGGVIGGAAGLLAYPTLRWMLGRRRPLPGTA